MTMQDNDDDGEAAAGGRIAHLMQLMEVVNVLVVVSRWYGGVKLGPDRCGVSIRGLGEYGLIRACVRAVVQVPAD